MRHWLKGGPVEVEEVEEEAQLCADRHATRKKNRGGQELQTIQDLDARKIEAAGRVARFLNDWDEPSIL